MIKIGILISIENGRNRLYQWDLNQRLILYEVNSGEEVHYAHRNDDNDNALVVKTYSENNKIYANIPNILLQVSGDMDVYVYVTVGNDQHTEKRFILRVEQREKPSDYVYTETETLTWKSLDERITELEKGVTVSTMTGATAETDGAAGLVPQPKAGEQNMFLKGDGTWDEADKTLSKDGYAADAKVVGEKFSEISGKIADGISWNELKDKPFYLNKTLFISLTKDDFTVRDQGGYVKYLYRSTPKLDWLTSLESIAFEIEIVDIHGKRYTATQDSIDVSFEKDTTDDGYEYCSCYSVNAMFDIVSGLDLDFYYNDEYYYKDEWGILVGDGRELSEINVKIYSIDVKKIPKICLDAEIGKTKITVGGLLNESEVEISPSVIVPNLLIPINQNGMQAEEIYCDSVSNRLRLAGNLFPYDGRVKYNAPSNLPVSAGESISFDISEGDVLWDRVSNNKWFGLLLFEISSYYFGNDDIEFLAISPSVGQRCAVVASNRGRIYTVTYGYAPDRKSLNITIKCVME